MVRDLFAHGAGAAVSALTHPRQTATRAAGLAQDAIGLGLGVARRTAATAVDRAAGVAGTVVPGRSHREEYAGVPDRTTTPAPPSPDTEPIPDPPEPEPAPTPPTRATDPTLAADEAGQAVSESGMALTDDYDRYDDEGRLTPSGIPAADEGSNPDTAETDLHQRETEPLMDPATVKAATAEARTMRKAASRRKD